MSLLKLHVIARFLSVTYKKKSAFIVCSTFERTEWHHFPIKKNNTTCGLEYALEKLKTLDEVASVEFKPEDIVRNPIITKIIENWKK